MGFFEYFTPISYWLLIILWSFIFVFYVKRIVKRTLSNQLFITLLTILSIDAFRSLFESVYFGFWYNSLAGFIPKSIQEFLVLPENIFFPKVLNIITATLIIFIVIRHWIPAEIAERKRELEYTKKLEKEVMEKEIIQNRLEESERQLNEAQEITCIGHYIFNIKNNSWSSSLSLNKIFGISNDYKRNVDGWANLIHPEDREMMISYLHDILSEHKDFNKEYRIVNAHNKEVFWVHGIGHLKFDKDGELSEMFGTIQDISEHKELVNDLETALKNIKVLSGLIPICSHCKDIRDDKGYWNQLETYINEHSDISFSHSLCPKCAKELYGDKEWYDKL